MFVYTLVQLVASPLTAPPAPPPAYTAQSRPAAETFTVDVEVRADRQLLFAGPLRVSTAAPASLQRDQNEAGGGTCPEQSYGGRASTRLRVQLSPTYDGRQSGRIAVSVSWTRPVERDCPLPFASRTVELTDSVVLVKGTPVTIAGDAGLVVTLRRR